MEDRSNSISPLTAKGYATIRETIEGIRSGGADTPEKQLEMLIDLFCKSARAVDPSITKMWVGRAGDGTGQPFFISMERDEGASSRRMAQ